MEWHGEDKKALRHDVDAAFQSAEGFPVAGLSRPPRRHDVFAVLERLQV
jgi:hypothetical protein